jgi:hypothetical protein
MNTQWENIVGDVGNLAADAIARRERASMAGARAGRGFRYQDAVAAALSAVGVAAGSAWGVAPEGGEDITLTSAPGTVHLQVRSRVGQRTAVTAAELASWFTDVWSRHADSFTDSSVRAGVVVDRVVAGVSATGLERGLEESSSVLADALTHLNLPPGVTAQRLLERSHLLVSDDPAGFASAVLMSHLGVVDAVADVVYRQLQALLGILADARSTGADPFPVLAAGDARRVIDDCLATVDVASLEAPVREGVCEHVDFRRSVDDPSFYLGVDVVPGHVVAGLVLDRAADVQTVIDRLGDRRAALITGPSGAGKTALAWLASYATRHSIRWLRVRQPGDLTALLRYVDALRPSVDAPVALVVDDIGSLGAPLWDFLYKESRHRPGVFLLGTTREEDLDLLESSFPAILIRPRLTEGLAGALWHELRDRGQTEKGGWIEAYAESDGLLLEFLHLLKTGDRLQVTIQAQVSRRRREGRDLELRILRIATLCASHGGATNINALQSLLGVGDEDLQRALVRLLEEHLISRRSDVAIAGLHRLRSEAIATAAHEVPPPTIAATAADVIRTVSEQDLPDVAASLVGRGVINDQDAFAAMTDRLQAAPTSSTLVQCLDALRLAGLLRSAAAWERVLHEEAVPPAIRHIAISLAMIRSDNLDHLEPRVAAALPRLAALELIDLRRDWLRSAPPTLVTNAIGAASDADSVKRLLNGFDGLADYALPELGELEGVAAGLDLAETAAIVDAARRAAPTLGNRFFLAAGGADHTLMRSRAEIPWVMSVELTTDSDARRVRFSWLYVDGDAEAAHESVVGLCRLFLGLFPDVDVAAGRAVDASGEDAGFADYNLAVKDIPRRNLPVPEEIRWTRNRIRAFAATAAVPPKTDRLIDEAALLGRTLPVVLDVGESWVRGKRINRATLEELEAIGEASFRVPVVETVPEDPAILAAKVTDVGDVASICHQLCSNALPRLLMDPNLSVAAFLHDTIVQDLTRIRDANYWQLLPEDHDGAVAELANTVLDLHAILCHRVTNPGDESSPMRRAIRRPGAQAISSTASLARRLAGVSLERRRAAVSDTIGALNLTATIYIRPPEKPSGVVWPDTDLLVVVEAGSALEWLVRLEPILNAVNAHTEPARTAMVAARRQGKILGDLAMSGHRASNGIAFPVTDGLAGWIGHVTGEIYCSPIVARLKTVLNAALVIGAVGDLGSRRELLEIESEVGMRAGNLASEAIEMLRNDIASDTTGIRSMLLDPIRELISSPNAITKLADVARGRNSGVASQLAVIQAGLIESELDPDGALDKLNRFFEQLAGQK